MAQISLNNGMTYVNAGDLTVEEAALVCAAAPYGCPDIAEAAHQELAPCDPGEFAERVAELHELRHGESYVIG